MERASGEYCLVAVRAHIADDVPEVVRDAVHFIEVIGIECDADVLRIHGRMALFIAWRRRRSAGRLRMNCQNTTGGIMQVRMFPGF